MVPYFEPELKYGIINFFSDKVGILVWGDWPIARTSGREKNTTKYTLQIVMQRLRLPTGTEHALPV